MSAADVSHRDGEAGDVFDGQHDLRLVEDADRPARSAIVSIEGKKRLAPRQEHGRVI
jgi:hypothetical protein